MNVIQNGFQYHLYSTEEATRNYELEAMPLRGNQKSANSDLNVSALEKAMDKEVEYGWSLPITINSIRHIKDVGFIPLGVAGNFSIDEKVELYTKICVILDFYFPGQSGLSFKNCLLRDNPHTCFYCFCLLRMLHMISSTCLKYASKRISIGKKRP